MSRTFYTLRSGKSNEQEIWDTEFDTFKDAYYMMCLIFESEKNKNLPHKYWGIWETKISEYDGKENSMTRAVWR